LFWNKTFSGKNPLLTVGNWMLSQNMGRIAGLGISSESANRFLKRNNLTLGEM
jgi:hypothetical protein